LSLTRRAIELNRVTIAALLLVLVAGLGAYRTMPRAEDPGFVVRTALVSTRFPGASPERVEKLVTDKLEKAIQEIPQLDRVRSQSKAGVSIIHVDIQDRYKEMRPIWDDLRRKVDAVRPELPDGVIGPVVNDEFGDVFGTILTITGDGFSYAELDRIADDVRDEILRIPDVAKIALYGTQEERVFVEYDNARLAELGLSPLQLRNALEARNILIPGGDVRTSEEAIVLEPSGSFESVDDLRDTLIAVPGRSELIALRDVARVERGYVDPARIETRASGRRALALAISLREGGNILTLGDAVRATVERLRAELPVGVDLEFAQFQAEAVHTKVKDFVGNLLQAVVIVLLVMLVSLGLRTGLVVATLIPMSMVAALLVMSFFSIGIDQMSLASLIIALGMLVDNAIVMSESIMVQMEEGKPALEAAVESADELKIPLLTSSLTTAAAFLPIYLAKSTTGEYTAPLFKVVTITLMCSWALSLTMIPLLCVLFLRVKRRERGSAEERSPFYRRYRATLALLLRHRWATIGVVAAVFFASMQLFRFIPVVFMPPHDRPTMTAELRLPAGVPFSRTLEVVDEVEAWVARELWLGEKPEPGAEGVLGWTTFAGQGAPRFMLSATPEQPTPEYAILLLNATSRPTVDTLVAKLSGFLEGRFPGLEFNVRPLQNGPSVAYPVEVRISGRDQDGVFAIVDRVKERLAAVSGVASVVDDWGARSKKLLVRVDEARARRAGVTHQDVAVSLQTSLSGIQATEYREGTDVIPVTLRSTGADRLDLAKLQGLAVFSQATGRSVPLEQVADAELAFQPANLRRLNRAPTVTVQATLLPGATANPVDREMKSWLAEESASWPIGYSWQLGGENENSSKANASIQEQLPVAGLIIVLLLVGQFNSVRRPLIILITIPLGLIGVIVGLLVLRSYFGFMTLLGIISLAGIVINNAIVLIDRIDLEIRNGRAPQEAILESAERRLRPILLTTMTTLGGLVPLYLGGGPMWEPMAVAIMFGLAFATVLTLGVVPVLYAIFFRVSFAAGGPAVADAGG